MLRRYKQFVAVPVVVVHHETTISLDGARTCALVQHRANLAKLTTGKTIEKIVLVQVISDFTVGQVTEFVAIGQVVDGDDLRLVTPVKCLDEIAADEACSAGYDNRHARFPVRVRSPDFNQGTGTQP